MRKMNLNLGWLILIIPLGVLFFVVIPELYGKYENHAKRETAHQRQEVVLDSLRSLTQPTTSDKHEIARLKVHVEVHGKVLEKERFLALKIGGMLLIFVFMFGGVFISGWVRKRKKVSTQREIIFEYQDPNIDAIGQQISWDALENGGTNFLSERLKKTAMGYKIAGSSSMKFYAWGFLLVGLNWLIWAGVEWFRAGKALGVLEMGKLFFTSGGPFVIVGTFLVLGSGAKAIFHMRKRIMIVGGKKRRFKEAYALQVLQKFVSGNSNGGFTGYELNLVTDRGERINLLNHGDKTYLLSDMVKISRFLKVPVWNGGVV
jgi:hypothetical protein